MQSFFSALISDTCVVCPQLRLLSPLALCGVLWTVGDFSLQAEQHSSIPMAINADVRVCREPRMQGPPPCHLTVGVTGSERADDLFKLTRLSRGGQSWNPGPVSQWLFVLPQDASPGFESGFSAAWLTQSFLIGY